MNPDADADGRTGPGEPSVLTLRPEPDPFSQWLRAVWQYRSVLGVLIRKDFQARYKRASFGILWALVVPALQATILAVVFSQVVRTGAGPGFSLYIISGVVAFSYFSLVLPAACTSIVDNAGMSDKVWFPRILLVVVPCISNLIGLAIALGVMLAIVPLLGGHFAARTLLVIPATALLILFTFGLGLVSSALQVYFRDVKFLVQAVLMVWMYVTPIVYTASALGPHMRLVADFNPLTGVVGVYHEATVGYIGAWAGTVTVSVVVGAALVVIGSVAHWRHDRLFVDRL